MFHFLVGTAALLIILVILPDLIWIGALLALVALVLLLVGAVVASAIIWPAVGMWIGIYVAFMAAWFAWDAFQTRFPHNIEYYLGRLYARLTK
jgi:hypothetical protein